jgi:hypothetical protein
MPLNIPNEGERQILRLALNNVSQEDLWLTLFGNNVTPAENDNVTFYTELTGGGYANIQLTGANWTVANGNNAVATYAAQTWTFTGATTSNTVYGYMVKGKVSMTVYWSEKFSDGPYPINNNGDAITITPRLELNNPGDPGA